MKSLRTAAYDLLVKASKDQTLEIEDFAALRTALAAEMSRSESEVGPAPNIPECTCDRKDDSWVGEPVDMPLCPYHEKRLRHLSWETLACIVIDYEAALHERSVT